MPNINGKHSKLSSGYVPGKRSGQYLTSLNLVL